MRTQGLTRAFLMEESEARIAGLAREGDSTLQSLIARRMLEEPHLYRHWEAEHDRLMRGVAETRAQHQVTALRSACFGLIHRKAMFEYLRVNKVTGRDRHAVFELVYGDQDYARAVVAEHGNYLRSLSSLACSHHLGLALLDDRAFGDPMSRYEARYADYFRAFCNSTLASNGYNNDDTLSTLLPYLKRQLGILRRAILAMPRESDIGGLHKLDIQPAAANSHRMSPFQSGVTAA
ncbi:MAG: hypothetical protein WDO68_00355 [Gammaproteobacteria bacterium]